MPHRSFRDSQGTEWTACDVQPQSTERRVMQRRQLSSPVPFPERRRAERRILPMRRPILAHGYGAGWLCFDAATERRRLSPIPGDWPRCSDGRLEEHCRAARPVSRDSLRLSERRR